MVLLSNWTEYIRQVLNFAGHGYEYYCPIVIPAKKEGKLIQIDKKIIDKYPMCEWGKDQRYRAKKANKANYVYLRWRFNSIIMHTSGQEYVPEDPDRFYYMAQVPYNVSIGNWVEIKVSKAKTGKKYTAYLSKNSYRNIKALLKENIEHKQWDTFEKHYYRLQGLPAFSGILGQMGELYRFCYAELKKSKSKITLKRLTLKEVF